MKPAVLALIATLAGYGQSGVEPPKYEVASIKPNTDGDFRFAFRIEPGGYSNTGFNCAPIRKNGTCRSHELSVDRKGSKVPRVKDSETRADVRAAAGLIQLIQGYGGDLCQPAFLRLGPACDR